MITKHGQEGGVWEISIQPVYESTKFAPNLESD